MDKINEKRNRSDKLISRREVTAVSAPHRAIFTTLCNFIYYLFFAFAPISNTMFAPFIISE